MNQGPWLELPAWPCSKVPPWPGEEPGMRQASSRLHHATAQASGWGWIDEFPATAEFHVTLIHFIASYFILFSLRKFWFDIGDV